jgi:predicted Zn-dependent protease
MKNHLSYSNTIFSLSLALLTILAGSGVAQAQTANALHGRSAVKAAGNPQIPGFGKKKDKAAEAEQKAAQKEQKDQQKAEKQERNYQALKQRAYEKYNSKRDADFNADVDEAYNQLRRDHSEFAFRMNTYDAQDERITFTGDKLKTEDTLYDNPLVQDYVNRVGQSLVPPSSTHRFAFKVILKPVPEARSLSTGTVYISTGLLSLIDNEAQLAYLLGHEIAHIENRHWFEDILVAQQKEEEERQAEKKRGWLALGIGVATGGIVGGASGSFGSGAFYGLLAGAGTYSIMKLAQPNKVISWDKIQEKEADQMGLKLMFDRNYDPREVPKLYARLKQFAEREPRTQDGFLAKLERVLERAADSNSLISGYQTKPQMTRGASNLRSRRSGETADALPVSPLEAGKPFGTEREVEQRERDAAKTINRDFAQILKAKLERNEIIGSSEEFEAVMADLKRDNGVRAFYYDMFHMALENLRESLQIRHNDPYTHYYFGKVLHLTARNRAEKSEAMQSFIKAINLDERQVLAEPWLHRALSLMADRNPTQNQEIVNYLRNYVEIYQQEHSGNLPPNMDAIYAYLKDLGDSRWVARPAMNVSTKNIEPLKVANPAQQQQQWQITPPQPSPSPNPPPKPGKKN